jgi:riboflavin kinase/FMN adenylyltransferase
MVLNPPLKSICWTGRGEFYGQTLQVILADYLRPEQKFPGLEELKQQIQEDCRQARLRLLPNPSPLNL